MRALRVGFCWLLLAWATLARGQSAGEGLRDRLGWALGIGYDPQAEIRMGMSLLSGWWPAGDSLRSSRMLEPRLGELAVVRWFGEGGWLALRYQPGIRVQFVHPNTRPEDPPLRRYRYQQWGELRYGVERASWAWAGRLRLWTQQGERTDYVRSEGEGGFPTERAVISRYPAYGPLVGLSFSTGVELRTDRYRGGVEVLDAMVYGTDSLAPKAWPGLFFRPPAQLLLHLGRRYGTGYAEVWASTGGYLGLEAELRPIRMLVLGWEGLIHLRAAGWGNNSALGIRVGLELDALAFYGRALLPLFRDTRQQTHPEITRFDSHLLDGNLYWNRFSPLRAELGLSWTWRRPEPLASIAGAEWRSTQIYTVLRERYGLEPWGQVWVQNRGARPVEVRLVVRLAGQRAELFVSDWISLRPRELRPIPVRLVLDPSWEALDRARLLDAVIEVYSDRRSRPDDRLQERFTIYERSAWDGDIATLPYYVEPQDEVVLGFARQVLEAHRAELDTVPPYRKPLRMVGLLVEALRNRVRYLADPELGYADRVQRPRQTLQSGFGDCEDLAVLLASVLASVGIRTAFVDTIEPDSTAIPVRYGRPLLDRNAGHVYLLVDTGVDPAYGELVSANRRRYLVRAPTPAEASSVWIPLEVTLLPAGFEAAWRRGAERAWEELGNGLDRPPRARIFDVN